MSVENVKVEFIRAKGYHDLNAWMENENNIYIGRGQVLFDRVKKEKFPQYDSPFCNPFRITSKHSREEVIERYKKYITEKIESSEEFKKELLALKGKCLGCWCKPDACHGDVLLELIEKYGEK